MFHNTFKMHPELPTSEFKSFVMVANSLVFKAGQRTYTFDAIASSVAKYFIEPELLKNPVFTTVGIQYRLFPESVIEIDKTAFKEFATGYPGQPNQSTELAMVALDDYLYNYALEAAKKAGKEKSMIKAVRVDSVIKSERIGEPSRIFEVTLTYPWTPVEAKKEIIVT